jgi:hypothetical protein
MKVRGNDKIYFEQHPISNFGNEVEAVYICVKLKNKNSFHRLQKIRNAKSLRHYTYARNGHYYFRMKVPEALCKEFGCSLFRKSLNTKSPQEANHIANILKDRFKNLFKQERTGFLSKREIKDSVNEIALST